MLTSKESKLFVLIFEFGGKCALACHFPASAWSVRGSRYLKPDLFTFFTFLAASDHATALEVWRAKCDRPTHFCHRFCCSNWPLFCPSICAADLPVLRADHFFLSIQILMDHFAVRTHHTTVTS